MVAPATTASDGSVTIPLSRAVVYWAHTGRVDAKTRMSAREKRVQQRVDNRLRNCLFIVFSPSEPSGVRLHILNNPAYDTVDTRAVRHQVTAHGKKQAQQLAEHDVHRRTTIIRHRCPNVGREIAVGETIQRQLGMPAYGNASFHEPLLHEFL